MYTQSDSLSGVAGTHTTGEDRNDFLHLFLKPDFQYPVGLVDYETLEIPEDESFRALETTN